MKSIMDFFRKLLPPLVYVGRVEIILTETIRQPTQKDKTITHNVTVALFMSADNKRYYKILGDLEKNISEYVKSTRCSDYQEILAWMEGGNFPKSFQPEDDPLREMLIRMVDKKLMGGDDDGQD